MILPIPLQCRPFLTEMLIFFGLDVQEPFVIDVMSAEGREGAPPPEPDIPYTDADYIADLDMVFPYSGELGDDERQLKEYEALLAIARAQGNRQREERMLGKIGDHYSLRAYDINAVIEYFNQQRAAAETIYDEDKTKTLLNQMRTYARLACDYYAQQLTIAHVIHDYEAQTYVLSWMARAYSILGETQQAIACQERRLAIFREWDGR